MATAICTCRWAGATSTGKALVPHLATVRPGTVLVLEIKERYWDSLRPSVERAWSLAQQINAAATG